jgi:hypothetical protein
MAASSVTLSTPHAPRKSQHTSENSHYHRTVEGSKQGRVHRHPESVPWRALTYLRLPFLPSHLNRAESSVVEASKSICAFGTPQKHCTRPTMNEALHGLGSFVPPARKRSIMYYKYYISIVYHGTHLSQRRMVDPSIDGMI